MEMALKTVVAQPQMKQSQHAMTLQQHLQDIVQAMALQDSRELGAGITAALPQLNQPLAQGGTTLYLGVQSAITTAASPGQQRVLGPTQLPQQVEAASYPSGASLLETCLVA
jgi:hypothetical protein